jgi:hypothetical protein
MNFLLNTYAYFDGATGSPYMQYLPDEYKDYQTKNNDP